MTRILEKILQNDKRARREPSRTMSKIVKYILEKPVDYRVMQCTKLSDAS